ncbi:hypothetical protein PHLCEN_2v7304 [Hermanssonia centrifuga]|uniref:Peroxidase n=1 Tax=Hermanssonia centrifuga TaxID=98765 RepID=A0A2R6NWY7_9APHY|nr:hypothetical protein PHLCEN_2v7304 [Hermanssonia centrifuga]
MAYKQLLTAVTLALAAAVTKGALTRRVACPDGVNTATNAACCALFAVRDDLNNNLFNNECGDEAHESFRLTFHDAIAISPALEAAGKFGGGGADGSIAIFSETETQFQANIGLDEVVEAQRPFLRRSGMGVADFIQFAGAVAVSNCPGAPQLNAFVATQPAPDGLVPEPFDSVDHILARFADAGDFDELETVWFLIAHSIAAQNDIDPTIPRTPFDSTPALMDGQFFIETQLRGTAFPGLTPKKSLADQAKLQNRFQFIFEAMGQLGTDPTTLIDCSEVLPVPPALPATAVPHFPAGKTIRDVEAAVRSN